VALPVKPNPPLPRASGRRVYGSLKEGLPRRRVGAQDRGISVEDGRAEEELEVSRQGPVMDALRRLAGEGFVEIIPPRWAPG